MPRIATAIAVHNRRAMTLKCIEWTLAQRDAEIDVYVFDDGSSDGTAQAIAEAFPSVRVIPGDGTAFWVRGMYEALEAAKAGDYDFYLWLNDDVRLDEDFLASLLATYRDKSANGPVIVVGATRGPDGEITYGGHRLKPSRFNLDFERLPKANVPAECDSFHGNCVLVPRAVVEQIGTIDSVYFHNFADFDYGLRARACGFRIWQAPGTIGICEINDRKTRHAGLLRFGRWPERCRAFLDPRFHHLPSRLRYFVRHRGLLGLIIGLSTVRYLIPFVRKRKSSGGR